MPTSLERNCREQFGINFAEMARRILPFFWEFTIETDSKKTDFVHLEEVLFGSIQPTNEEFIALCEFIRDRLAYSGQVLSLVTLLNDKYDDPLRRIFIECLGANFVEGSDLYNNDEEDPTPIDLYNNLENPPAPLTLWNNDEVTDPSSLYGISFIIHIPADVPQSDELIRALLAFYVIAVQQYKIIRF